MSERKRRIVFLAKTMDAASTRYRAEMYATRFREDGYEVEVLPLSGSLGVKLAALNAARKADVVVLLRKTLAWPYSMCLCVLSKRLIYDLDDAVFLSSTGEVSKSRGRRFAYLAKRADVVFAGNSYLAGYASKYCEKIVMMPTIIDPKVYEVDGVKPGGSVDLVWIGSSATRKYLEGVLPAIEGAAGVLKGEGVRLRLKIVADFDLDGAKVETVAVQWAGDIEAKALADSHIGLAPMPNDLWTQGKCGLKVLQYMAAGLPTVGSRTGVHVDQIVDGETGYLVEGEAAWQDGILRLARDSEKREVMGAAAKRMVNERYTLDINYAKMKGEFERMMGG